MAANTPHLNPILSLEFPMSHNPAPVQLAQKPPRLKGIAIGTVAVAVLIVVLGLFVRFHQHRALVQWTDAQLIPNVRLAPSSDNATHHTITLPGHLEAWDSAPIHARVSGYLKSWDKDIGAKVTAGELLATIDTPELDQQLAQAKADLVKAQADAKLADITSKRWQHLLTSDSVSKQEADEKAGQEEAAQATVLAVKANLDRLMALESFKRIVAPFDGTVVARRTDVGDLISADNGSGPELFTVADTTRMRLYVEVPQVNSSGIKPGMHVQLSVPDQPGKTFDAMLLGTSEAISQKSGSLLAQFVADNTDGTLRPGDYAEVALSLPSDHHVVTVPASALIFRAAGPQVAVLDADGRVSLHKVHIAIDLGATLEIDQGLASSDRVIENPPDSLMAGDQVRVDNATNGAPFQQVADKESGRAMPR
jgi:membrane fusion protein, multidrug efflux system